MLPAVRYVRGLLPPGCETETRGLRSFETKALLELCMCITYSTPSCLNDGCYRSLCAFHFIYPQAEDGEVPMTQATAPAAAGVAMEVPDILLLDNRFNM